MAQVTLTDFEKKVLRDMMNDGYFFDDYTSNFITWGVSGKAERGALTSLGNKGVVCVQKDEEGTMVFCGEGYTKYDIAEISDWNKILPWGEHYTITKEDCI